MPSGPPAAASGPLPPLAVAPAAEPMGPPAPAVVQGVPAVLEQPQVSVAPPDAVPLHAAPPTMDELAQRAQATSQAYQAQAGAEQSAYQAQAKAIDAKAKVDEARATAEAKAQAAFAEAQQKLLDEQAKRNAAAAEAQAKAGKLVDDAAAKAAATPFDPDHYVKSMGLGGTALTALSLVFGGIGQAFGGGPNVGLSMLNKSIDNDIDVQRMNYQKARQTVADRQNSYAMLRDAGMTDQQAQLGARQVLSAQLQSQLAVIGSQYAGPTAQANRQLLQASLQQTHADAQGKMLQQVGHDANESWDRRVQLQAMQDSALGAATRVPNDPAATHQREMEQLTIPGLGGHAKTPEEHQKAVIIEQTYRKLIPMLDEMRQMREQHGRNLLPYSPEVAARAANLANSVHLLGKDLFQLGVLSDSDNKLLDKVFPANPLASFTLDSTVFGQIAQFQKNATEARRSQLQTMGFEIQAPGHDVLDAPAGEKPEA